MSFAKLRDGEGNTLMIPRSFVGMTHMKDVGLRTDKARGMDSMLPMYRVYELRPLNPDGNWNTVLHRGFLL